MGCGHTGDCSSTTVCHMASGSCCNTQHHEWKHAACPTASCVTCSISRLLLRLDPHRSCGFLSGAPNKLQKCVAPIHLFNTANLNRTHHRAVNEVAKIRFCPSVCSLINSEPPALFPAVRLNLLISLQLTCGRQDPPAHVGLD